MKLEKQIPAADLMKRMSLEKEHDYHQYPYYYYCYYY
jgi:hypothetical protein